MYKNYDNAHQTATSIHAGKHISDKEPKQISEEQDNDTGSIEQDKSEGSTTIVVPFNTTQTGSFQ